MLGSILHDWNDQDCRRILTNCRDALPSGGTLLVCEKMRAAGSRWSPGARERTEAEYRSLLAAGGFRVTDVMSIDAPRDVIVATRR